MIFFSYFDEYFSSSLIFFLIYTIHHIIQYMRYPYLQWISSRWREQMNIRYEVYCIAKHKRICRNYRISTNKQSGVSNNDNWRQHDAPLNKIKTFFPSQISLNYIFMSLVTCNNIHTRRSLDNRYLHIFIYFRHPSVVV